VTTSLPTLALVLTFALGSTAIGRAQEKPAPPATTAPKAAATITPIKVQVLISRYQGEKKISSMPYNLSMNAMTDGPGPMAGRANLRMGARVPVVMLAMTNVPKDAPQGGPIQYQDVGTNIDCGASTLADGRFRLEITVDDSSVYPEDATSSATKNSPLFRSFRATDAMILKDGQTAQFTTATDKVNGETVRIDVTLTVVK
jgi:hypothetical protein